MESQNTTYHICTTNADFQLSCESTTDLPFEMVSGKEISTIFYSYSIDGKEYYDDMGKDPAARGDFYQQLRAGKFSTTTQVNNFRYTEYFRALLEKGDVLHIAFTSGLTPSVYNAIAAAKTLQEEYPHRKIIVVDSMAGSFGYGLLMLRAAEMRDAGATMEEIADWIRAKGTSVHHCFYVADLTTLKKAEESREHLPRSLLFWASAP